MNAERSVREGGWLRAVFCLVLVAALVCGLFALNGFAAGTDPADYDIKVDSCSTHTAALSSGTLYMWGTNDHGQFPNTESTYAVEPVKVAEDVLDVAVSDNRTLVVYKNGDLYMYGRDPIQGTSGLSKKIANGATQVFCGSDFAMYITQSGALMSWGSNSAGQLGDGTKKNHLVPAMVMEDVKKAAVGDGFALALKKDGSLYGWGSDAFLQIGWEGDGDTPPESVTEPVLVAENVQDVDAGDAFSCVLKEDGSLYTCGLNSSGQAGVDTARIMSPLTKVLDHVRSIAAGDAHGFAIKENGKVYAWGYGLSGQLGDPDAVIIPVTEMDMEFVRVFAGDGTSFGVSPDGSLYSWGDNTNRLLCTVSGVDAHEPVQVLDADMTWIAEEEDVTDAEPEQGTSDPDASEPGASNPGTSGSGSDTSEPASSDEAIVVKTPFVSGSGSTFRPNDNVTRAEFLKMVAIGLTDFDEDKTYPASGFDDVAGDKWYAPYIAYAKEAKLVSGSGSLFRPNDPITRAEAAKIAVNAMKLPHTAKKSSFNDVTGWAVPYVEALSAKKIVSGYKDGGFHPQDPITRAEAVKIVCANTVKFSSETKRSLGEQIKNPFTDVEENKWYFPYILYAAGKISPEA